MFQIDSMSRKPVYEQIIEQVESFLLNDVLKPGDQIPSVRNVTMQHAINPRTVLKAYNDLDARGLIRSVPGKGYFVCEEAKQILNQRHMEQLQELKKKKKWHWQVFRWQPFKIASTKHTHPKRRKHHDSCPSTNQTI